MALIYAWPGWTWVRMPQEDAGKDEGKAGESAVGKTAIPFGVV